MSELPLGWVTAVLGDIVRPVRERTDPRSYPNLPYLGLEHIEAHTMRILEVDKASNYRSSAARFERGNVLYGRLRPYLNKVVQPSFDGLCSGEFIVLSTTSDVCADFVRYLLNSSAFVSFASHLKEGDRPRVDFEQIAEYRVWLPPLAEQRRIVAEIEKQFTRLDDAQLLLGTSDRKLGMHWRSSLQQAFARIAPVMALRDITSRIGDVDHKMPKAVERGVPYVSTKDFIGDTEINVSGAKQISVSDFEQLCRKISPSAGDILLSRYGTVGEVRLVPEDFPVFQASYSIAIIKPLENVDSRYLAYALRASRAQQQIRAGIRASSQPDLGLQTIRELQIPIPTLSDQKQIADELDAQWSELRWTQATIARSFRHSARLRQAILTRAFCGQLVPQDPDDEPASVLLESVRAERGRNGTAPSKARRTGSRTS